MKHLFVLLLCLPLAGAAQQLVLLDRKMKAPFELRDSVTFNELAAGSFPLYVADLDAVVQHIDALTRRLADDVDPVPADSLRRNHSIFSLRHRRAGSAHLYSCMLQTIHPNFSVPLVIASDLTRKEVIRNLSRFTQYLRNNRAQLPGNAALRFPGNAALR